MSRLEKLAEQAVRKEVDRSDAAVAGQLLNYALRGIAIGLKAVEQEEPIARLEAVEAELAAKKRAAPWA